MVSSQSDGVMASKTLRCDRECFHEIGEYKRLPRRGPSTDSPRKLVAAKATDALANISICSVGSETF